MKKRNRLFCLTAFLFSLSTLVGCSPNKDPTYYSVIYEYNEFPYDPYNPKIIIDGDYRNAEFVKPGEIAHEPDISYLGEKPQGWYASPFYEGEKFDFSTPINQNTQLWAKWIDPEADITGVKWTEAAKNTFSNMLLGDFKEITDDMWTTVPTGSEKYEKDNVQYTITDATGTEIQIKDLENGKAVWGGSSGEANLTVTITSTVTGKSFSDTITVKVKDTIEVPTPEDPHHEEKVVTVNDVEVYDTNEPTSNPVIVPMGETKETTRIADVTFNEETGQQPTNTNVKYEIVEGGDIATVTINEKGQAEITFVNTGMGSAETTVVVKVTAENSNDGTQKTDEIKYIVQRTTHIEEITLDPTSVVLFYADSGYDKTLCSECPITATIDPIDPTNPNLIWETSDPSITISGEYNLKKTLIVDPSIKAGTEKNVTITVRPEDSSSIAQPVTCNVKIVIPAITLNFATKEKELELKEEFNQQPSFTSKSGVDVSDECKTLTWSSSDEGVATVDTEGNVTAVGGGEATIKAVNSYNKLLEKEQQQPYAEYKVKVNTHVKTIELNKKNLTMVYANSGTSGLKEYTELKATCTPSTAPVNLVWESSNTDIVTVEKTGELTATIKTKDATSEYYKGKGTDVTITVKNIESGKETCTPATCVVHVVLPVETMSLDQSKVPSYLFIKGETYKQDVTFDNVTKESLQPSDECKTLTWSSSDEGVATVDTEGNVTAVGGGEATITATSSYDYEGKSKTPITASYVVKVAHELKSIELDTEDIFLANKIDGFKSKTVHLTISPEAVDEYTIEWVCESDIINIKESEDKRTATITSTEHFGETTIYVYVTDLYGNVLDKEINITNYDTDPTPEKLSFTSTGSAYTVSAGKTTCNGNVNIPDKYGDEESKLPVSTINSSGFSGKALQNILIPHSITSIGKEAFYGCQKLGMVLFNPSAEDGNLLTTIGDKAFYKPAEKDTKLNYVGLECCKNLTTIGASAFENQLVLSEITIPSNVNYIGDNAFNNCISLRTVVIDSVLIAMEDNPGNLFDTISLSKKVVKVPAGVTVGNTLKSYYTKTTEGSYDVYTQK